DAASLRSIARRAHTNIGMIYYYFPNKDDLFLGVIEEPYQHIVTAMSEILGRDVPARERIRLLYRRIASFTPEEADTFRLAIREAIQSPGRRSRVFERAWRGHLPLVVATLEGAKREGVVDPSIPTPLLMIATAAMGLLPQVAARSVPL